MAGPSQQNTKQLLDEIATCSMCLDLFKKPKSLPCLHTFCLDCLLGFTISRPGTYMKCPLCRKDFQIPQGGFEALPSNFLIEQLLHVNAREISTSGGYKVDCHTDGGKLQSGTENAQLTGSATGNAPQTGSDADREQLRLCSVKLDSCLKNNEDELKQLDTDKIKLLKEISASEEGLTKRSYELKQLLDSKHKILLEELESIKNKRLCEIASRRNDVEEQSTMLVSFQQYSKQITDGGAWGEMQQSLGDLRANAAELAQSAEKFNKSRLREVSVSFAALPTTDICIGKICLIAVQQPPTDSTDTRGTPVSTQSSNVSSSTSTLSNTSPPLQRTVTTGSSLSSAPSNTPPPLQRTVTTGNSHSLNQSHSPSRHHGPNQSQNSSKHQTFSPSSNRVAVPTLVGNVPQQCTANNPFDSFCQLQAQLFTNLTSPSPQQIIGGPLHPGVTCDGCQGEVRGCRYKCQVCPDFDLCETCSAMNRHSQHAMTPIETPQNFPPYPFHTQQPPVVHTAVTSDALHFGVTCDGCHGQVRGTRYKCVVCPNFDLCEACNAAGFHSEFQHGMKTIDVPRNPPSYLGGVFHPGITCNECGGAVRGKRFKCKVCPNFDLCELCKWADKHSHHDMITIKTPKNRNYF